MATATVASSTNTNIEKIGSIKVLSSTSPTANEKSGLIFGGYGYSSDVQANNGEGYSISIKVISKDGKYQISSKDLNVTAKGSKNIIVGNFTFYDFYLVSYSIDKEVENSILTLTYKDKSIFMDKVFIGLFNHHYGNVFDLKGQFRQNSGILDGEITSVNFKYKCTNNKYTDATLIRLLSRVQTLGATEFIYTNNISKFPSLSKSSLLPEYLKSDAFFCRYAYPTMGINGGYIILGREELNEENCSLPEVSYCFKDLTSALAYAKIPGIIDFNLGNDNEIYRILRRNYFGSLRNVLDQWGGDFGFKFYYQPKIDFKIKDYSNENSVPVLKTIQEGIKLINLTSTSTTLKNLNQLFDSNDKKYDASLQKVVESLSETATLEGTRKTNVITPIRREARSFNSESSSINYKTTEVLPLGYLPAFNLNDPSSSDTIIGGTLSIYDEQLRDLYHLNNKNYKALGIIDYIDLTVDPGKSNPFIASDLDFLQTFGTTPVASPSNILSDYIILLAVYSEDRHALIKDWEKSIMTEYYNQYYMVGNQEETSSCNNFSNFSVSYSTTPPSQSYIANQLPFVKLLNGQYGNDKLDFKFGTKRYNPIFKAENPFGASNDSNYKNFIAGIADYESYKTLTIINFKNDPKAGLAFLYCLSSKGNESLFEWINTKNVSLILSRKINSTSSKITSIGFDGIVNGVPGSFVNNAVVVAGTVASKRDDSVKNCPKTVCEQSLAETVCGDGASKSEVNETNTGFMSNLAKKIKITSSISTSCELLLPVDSDYKYAQTKSTSSIVTLAASSYVLGTPPTYESENVMSHEVIDNTVPEILTQSSANSTGMIDQIVTFDDTGKNALVLSAREYHDRVSKNLNNSVPDAFEQKKISLTSTYIPLSMVDYIFTSPILNSMNFSFNESGFNTTLDFSSRPRQPKQKDSLFLTQRFLRKL
jgi:hypothetical protein